MITVLSPSCSLPVLPSIPPPLGEHGTCVRPPFKHKAEAASYAVLTNTEPLDAQTARFVASLSASSHQ
ncbi:transposase [Pseudomonas chlororaphis]